MKNEKLEIKTKVKSLDLIQRMKNDKVEKKRKKKKEGKKRKGKKKRQRKRKYKHSIEQS